MRYDTTFDESVEGAWRAFRIDLADQVSRLDHGDEITVVQSTAEFPGGPHGALRFSFTGSRRIRCSLAVADLHSTDTCRLDEMSRLMGMGWRPLRTRQRLLIIESGRRRVDELVATAVRALREIWEVVHPTFLVGGDRDGGLEPSMPIGVTPRDPEDLQRLVAESLSRRVNRTITVDDDGDIRIPTGDVASWLRICHDEPSVEFFACILDDVPDMFEAAHFITTRVPRWPGITLQLIDKNMYASLRVGTAVFHDENLTAAVKKWITFITDDVPQIRDDLATPRLAWKPDMPADLDDSRALPDSLQAVLHLLEDGPTHPYEIAQLCDFNSRTLIDHLKIGVRELKNWSEAAERSDDPDEAAACDQKNQEWRDVMKSLVAALRLVLRIERRRHSNTGKGRRSRKP